MMQSCASAAKLRVAGPFSPSASVPCLQPVPATSDHQSAVRPERQGAPRIGKKPNREEDALAGDLSAGRTEDVALRCLASRDKAPERDQQLACQGDDHGFARAPTAIDSAGPVPPRQCAVLLKSQKAPGELDHAAADP